MDGLVQLARQTVVDTDARDDRVDMADPLPDHPGHLWVCILSSFFPTDSRLRGRSLCDQPRGEFRVHADTVWVTEPTTREPRHRDRFADDRLGHVGDLALPPVGRTGSGSLPRVGSDRNGPAMVNHLVKRLA